MKSGLLTPGPFRSDKEAAKCTTEHSLTSAALNTQPLVLSGGI